MNGTARPFFLWAFEEKKEKRKEGRLVTHLVGCLGWRAVSQHATLLAVDW